MGRPREQFSDVARAKGKGAKRKGQVFTRVSTQAAIIEIGRQSSIDIGTG